MSQSAIENIKLSVRKLEIRFLFYVDCVFGQQYIDIHTLNVITSNLHFGILIMVNSITKMSSDTD